MVWNQVIISKSSWVMMVMFWSSVPTVSPPVCVEVALMYTFHSLCISLFYSHHLIFCEQEL